MESTPRRKRPLRADALRNREQVLVAARACFAKSGQAAQMDDIAERAGVSVATVYRHFPDKETLFATLVIENSQQAAAFARAALGEPDVWLAFAGFLERCAELQAENRGLCEALIYGFAIERWADLIADAGLMEATATLIGRGQREGAIRADARPDDVALIIGGLAATMLGGGGPVGGDWHRFLAICLDGLRPIAGTSLPG